MTSERPSRRKRMARRSGRTLGPPPGSNGEIGYWYCPIPGCPTVERAGPDGSLGSGRCAKHGEPLTASRPEDSGGQAS
jgi:hypothetical protein